MELVILIALTVSAPDVPSEPPLLRPPNLLTPPEADGSPFSALRPVELTPPWMVVGGRILAVVGGAWAAGLTHELGHAVVTWGHGYEFAWPTTYPGTDFLLPYWEVREDLRNKPSERRNIAAGGFLLSEVVSELLLNLDVFPKSDAFVGGFLFYDLLNSLLYVIRDAVLLSQNRNGAGDIRDMSDGGIPRGLTYTVLLAKSALTLGRVLENPEFLRLSFWSTSTEPP